MKTYLACSIMFISVIAHSMEPDIPDQKTVKTHVATIAHACFKNYPNLTLRQREYALTSLAELYAHHDNEPLHDLQKGELKAQHKEQLRASVLSQIESNVNRAIANAEYDSHYFEREEQEQRTTSYITKLVVLVVVTCIMFNTLLGTSQQPI